VVSKELYLSSTFADLWKGKDPFEEVEKINGEVYRELDGRKTLRFELDGKGYFLKIHRGVGWKEILKNLIQLRLPVLGAENEWKAIDKLKSIDVDTMTYVAYGKMGWNPAAQRSFIVTEDLAGCISLEDYCLTWHDAPPLDNEQLAIIEKVARIAQRLHDNGINHRDLYICHFLLNITLKEEEPVLYLIDLHRAQLRNQIPSRWRIKDVASIVYSMLEVRLSKDKIDVFKASYSNGLTGDKGVFWRAVDRKSSALLLQDKAE